MSDLGVFLTGVGITAAVSVLVVAYVLHCALGWCLERVMTIPLVSLAQLRILSEGIVEPFPPCDRLPDDLQPRAFFTADQIRKGLPNAGAFGLKDLRWFA